MLFTPGTLSVIGCPAQRQSAEAVRRVRDVLIKAGAKLDSDNVYGLELDNGSRVMALPSSDDSIHGLTVDAWIAADEAARLPDELIAALHPMRARCSQTRFGEAENRQKPAEFRIAAHWPDGAPISAMDAAIQI